jgi:serine/threonine protein kinase/tetratricopeptide (TPR) repeat protein
MSDSRFHSAARLFLAARDMRSAQRRGFLDATCGSDVELRDAVESLLGGDEAPQSGDGVSDRNGLRETAVGTIEYEDDSEGRHASLDDDEIPRFKKLERLGEGGFGTVWLAEQLEPVRRVVALKVLKPGMDSRNVLARFEAERQALARMDHPNITRVFDAGVTRKGRPFFVMELVRGVPITEYCERERLAPRERVALFLSVCNAIEHAHQKGILHRDLKPSNVLVTLHDGVPVPKVIDFGIAKALTGRLTDRTLHTHFKQFIGTPAYMSPEQAEMSGLDVDTRSDIYSLGVLLYELLTATTPFEKEKLAGVSPSELQRMLRDVDPPTPSRRLSTQGGRHTGSRSPLRDALVRQLRGDLDWIVMRCLEKDRTRRYPSADALAQDLKRHLDDLPVEAGPPSTTYRLSKLARRHRLKLLAASVALGGLLSGLAAALYGQHEAQSQRDAAMAARGDAMAEAARAGAVVDLLLRMFQSADPTGRAHRDDSLRRLLDDFSMLHGSRLEEQPEVLATVHRVVGAAYLSLGDLAAARPHAETGLALARRIYGHDHEEVAAALTLFGRLDDRAGRYDGAEAKLREALTIQRKHSPPFADEVAQILLELSQLLRHKGDPKESLRLAEEVYAMHSAMHGKESIEAASASYNVAISRNALAMGEPAEQAVSEALTIYERELKGEHPWIASALELKGTIRWQRGDLAGAEPLMRQAAAMRERLLGPDHYEVALSRANVAWLIREQGRADEALPLFERSLASLGGSLGEDHPHYVSMLGKIGSTLFMLGRANEAAVTLRRTVEKSSKLNGVDHPATADQEGNLVLALTQLGEFEEAEALSRHVLDVRRATYGPHHLAVAAAMHNLANLLFESSRLPEAEKLQRETIAVLDRAGGERHPRALNARVALGRILRHEGRLEEAEAVCREAILGLREVLPAAHPDFGTALEELADSLAASQRHEDALPILREAHEAFATAHGPDSPATLVVRSKLGATLAALSRFDEAMSHLIGAAKGLESAATAKPWQHRDAVARVVAMFEAWGRPEEAARWR